MFHRLGSGAAVPQPVGTLERQEPGAPALVHARSLGSDLVGRGIHEIAQHLPRMAGSPSRRRSMTSTATASARAVDVAAVLNPVHQHRSSVVVDLVDDRVVTTAR